MKKSILIFLTGLLLLGVFVGGASAAIGGSGTESDPYTISSEEDLRTLEGSGYAPYVGNNVYFELTTDIYLNSQFTGVGNNTYIFNGIFNGNNHTVYNSYMDVNYPSRLIYYVGNNSHIHHVNLNGGSICLTLGGSVTTGVICEINDVKCENLTGVNMGITNSIYSQMNIHDCVVENSHLRYAGICYSALGGTIDNCIVKDCYIKYRLRMGVTAGILYSAAKRSDISPQTTIQNCTVENCILATSYGAGGIFGQSEGTRTTNQGMVIIRDCDVKNCTFDYWYDDLSSSSNYTYTGGIFGRMSIPVSSNVYNNLTVTGCTVENCCFSNSHSYFAPTWYAAGYNYSNSSSRSLVNISNCTFSNNYFPPSQISWCSSFTNGGGLQYVDNHGGYNVQIQLISSPSLTNDTSESSPKSLNETVTFNLPSNSFAGAALYTEAINSGKYLFNVKSGYDFNYGTGGSQVGDNPFTASYSSTGTKNVILELKGQKENDTSEVQTIIAGTFTSIAYIDLLDKLNGSGTQSDPYQVASDEDLHNWSTYYSYYDTSYMTILQDFTPTATVMEFNGNLNGNNHTLTNVRLPLFNTLGGTVNNLKFSKSIINGNGVLANTSSAAVSNITADDCVISGTTTGGLVGNATGSFTDCTVNHITVKGSISAGGIAGAGDMTITRCHVLNSDLLAPTTYGVCS